MTQQLLKYFDVIWLHKNRSYFRLNVLFKGQTVDALESSGTTNPTEIFQPPQVSQNLRNNAKPWFQTEILSMM